MDRQNPRINGKSKAIQTKSHKESYTYPLIKSENGKIYIYLNIIYNNIYIIYNNIYSIIILSYHINYIIA